MTNLPLVHLDLGLVCLYWKLRIFLLFTSTWAGVSVLEMTNLPLVHLDLGWCVCIGNDKSSSYSPGPGLVWLYWKWRIFLLFTWTWACVSVLEKTNPPLVHLDLGWCVCIGNNESLSCSTGSGLVCLYWKFSNHPLVHLDLGLCVYIGNDESSSCSPRPGLVCLSWKWRIFLLFTWTWANVSVLGNLRICLLFTWTWAGVSVLEIRNFPLVHLDLR